MGIKPEEVEKVIRLAQLRLAPEAQDRLREQLNQMLDYFDQIDALDVTGVDPTESVTPIDVTLRSDECTESLDRDVLLRRAPKTDGEYFIVPQVIESTE